MLNASVKFATTQNKMKKIGLLKLFRFATSRCSLSKSKYLCYFLRRNNCVCFSVPSLSIYVCVCMFVFRALPLLSLVPLIQNLCCTYMWLISKQTVSKMSWQLSFLLFCPFTVFSSQTTFCLTAVSKFAFLSLKIFIINRPATD